ncbi:hypothetical protein [Dishui Lake virophage 2]|nr:hypothetical protein [Dishui Lake virophage 2]
MPQANITYDIPYNRKMVDILREMDEKHWRKAGDAYAPTMFSEKLGNFHGAKIGGGSPANQQYIHSGNSPAYPPVNMNSGMAVSSGGMYSGIDGAVGGKYSVDKFVGDFKKVGKLLKPVAKPILTALTNKAVAKLGGFSELMTGCGRPAPKNKMDVVDFLKPLGAKKSHSLNRLHELVAPYRMEGGKYSVDKFVRDFGKIGKLIKPVAKPILKALTDKAVAKVTGAGMDEEIELVRPMEMAETKGKGKKGGKYSVDKFVKDFGKIGKLIKPVAKPIVKALTDKAVAKIGGGGGRAKRAEIVKKVMAEKGMKMIEASKYVKEHGLY